MAKPIKKTKKPSASKKTAVTKKKTIALKTKRPLKKLIIKKPVKKTTKRLFTKKVKSSKKRNIIITVALACCALAAVIIPTAVYKIADNVDNANSDVLGASFCGAALNAPYVGQTTYGTIFSFANLINPNGNKYNWSSSDYSILSIMASKTSPEHSVMLAGLKEGKVVVKVTSSKGCSQSINVNVKKHKDYPFKLRLHGEVKTTTIGDITIFEEGGCNSDAVYMYKKTLRYMPVEHKYFNNLYFETKESFGTAIGGVTLNGKIFVECSSAYWNSVIPHESMHAFDNAWYVYRGGELFSNKKDVKDLYDYYKKLYKEGRGFPKSEYHDYAMSNSSEFWARMYEKYFLKKNINNNNLISVSDRNKIYLPNDVSAMISKYVKPITEFKYSDLYSGTTR